MSDPAAPGAGAGPNVAALVDAIDARARQAGTEGATTIVRGMVGSISELLSAIQDRLDRVEELLVSGGSNGGGADAVAESVQSGLAAFNARLGRLEEAFVQAVDDSGSGTQAVVDDVRAAVEGALAAATARDTAADMGARTAEAVAELTQRLAVLEERLVTAVAAVVEREEAPAPAPAPPPAVSPLDLRAALAPVHDQLEATQARITAALSVASASNAAREGAEAAVAPVLDRLAAIEARMAEADAATSTQESRATVEDAFEIVQVRLSALDQLVRSRSNQQVDAAAALRAALAPVLERLDRVEAAQRLAADAQSNGLARVDTVVSSLPSRLASLEERVLGVVANLTESASSVDASLIARFEEVVDRLDRDESSARLVRLVEERLSSAVRALIERSDAVRNTVDELTDRRAGESARLDEVVGMLRTSQSADLGLPEAVANAVTTAVTGRLGPLGDRIGGLDARLDGLDARIAGLDDNMVDVRGQLESVAVVRASVQESKESLDAVAKVLDELANRPPPEPPTPPESPTAAVPVLDPSELADRVTDAVRREAELLTQRVAALAVGVEAARVLLEQHVEETENSLGRKAGEVTRRLAADLGIRGRKGGAGGRRDPRELGSG